MELNVSSKQALQQVKKKTEAKLIAYTNKDYVCQVVRGVHYFHNNQKSVEYIPSANIPDFIAKHRKLAKSIAIKRLLAKKKICSVILQSFNFIGFKMDKEIKSISNFKPVNF